MREFEVQLVSLQKSFLTFILYSFRLLLYLYITGSLPLPVAPHSPHGKLRSVEVQQQAITFQGDQKVSYTFMKFLDVFRHVGALKSFLQVCLSCCFLFLQDENESRFARQ
jgi:hypothetical protein